MKKLYLVPVFLGLLLQSGPTVISIPIVNPSFDQHGTSTSDGPDQCGQHYYNIPGWHFSSGSVVQTPPNFVNPLLPCGTPDGSFAAGAGWGSTVSQDVGPALGDGVYTLKFQTAAYNYWYTGSYKAAISLTDSTGKTGEICATSGYAMGDFTPITLVCPAQRLGSGELKIVFTGTNLNGFPVLFAGPVSLTFMEAQ